MTGLKNGRWLSESLCLIVVLFRHQNDEKRWDTVNEIMEEPEVYSLMRICIIWIWDALIHQELLITLWLFLPVHFQAPRADENPDNIDIKFAWNLLISLKRLSWCLYSIPQQYREVCLFGLLFLDIGQCKEGGISSHTPRARYSDLIPVKTGNFFQLRNIISDFRSKGLINPCCFFGETNMSFSV